ncbi:PP2C family protein-serine/threonine phosphatase [Kitasatospora sp. NPDC088346]|uniref:PP2C family protein-serine/threonine phosphatase n=1 Tax=Kitasatospora sp. NPDC088346 TaxID=3364073 RepID=UPI0038128194
MDGSARPGVPDPGRRVEDEMDWTLHWSTAGHPPPRLIGPDGTAHYLHADPGLPLGVDTDMPRPDHKHPLPGNSTLVLFKDGLVEHPDHPIDAGLTASPESRPPAPARPWTTCAARWPTPSRATAATTWPSSPCAPHRRHTIPWLLRESSPRPVDRSMSATGRRRRLRTTIPAAAPRAAPRAAG